LRGAFLHTRTGISLRQLIILGQGAVLLLLLACAGWQPSAQDWADSSKCLWIEVESDPQGAEVYGVLNDSLGDYLGQTPFLVKFYSGGGNRLYCLGVGPKAPVSQMFVHSGHSTSWVSPDGRYDHRAWDRHQAYPAKDCALFHCFVIKAGYEPHLVEIELEATEYRSDYANALTGEKSYTAHLEPLAVE
jgi:hypothetical protein